MKNIQDFSGPPSKKKLRNTNRVVLFILYPEESYLYLLEWNIDIVCCYLLSKEICIFFDDNLVCIQNFLSTLTFTINSCNRF